MWEITPTRQSPVVFDKVGKQMVSEAAKVIGLNVVKLGDADISVNIMDQLESHFMLASLGGQDASGSLRAQVIDEISGLSGIEGVIKDVSLDNHRIGREVKETEDKMEENRKQLHDEVALQTEESLLVQTEKLLSDSEAYSQSAVASKSLLDDTVAVSDSLIQSQSALDQIPDVDRASESLDELERFLVSIQSATELFEEWDVGCSKMRDMDNELNLIPDVDSARACLDASISALDGARAMVSVLSEHSRIKIDAVAIQRRLQKLKKAGDPSISLRALESACESKKRASELVSESNIVCMKMREVERRLGVQDLSLKKAIKEKDNLMALIKVCPLTLKPVSQQCLEDAK
jgi:hypothetical protein